MIGCMTCSWAPTTGGMTAQSGQRNDGATRSSSTTDSVNRTLHADIEKPTTIEKTCNYLHKINSYVFMKK